MPSPHRIAFALARKPYRILGFCSRIGTMISARFCKEAKLRRTDLLIGESHIGRWSYYTEWFIPNSTCLAPRRLSLDENMRAKEGGKETTGETVRRACRLYPSHGPLRFITSRSPLPCTLPCEKQSAWGGGWNSTALIVQQNEVHYKRCCVQSILITVLLQRLIVYCEIWICIFYLMVFGMILLYFKRSSAYAEHCGQENVTVNNIC